MTLRKAAAEKAFLLSLSLSLSLSVAAFGQSTSHGSTLQNEPLSQSVTNPIALLTKLTAENKYSPSQWDVQVGENQVEGELVLPFIAFSKQNLARIKVFFQTSSSDGTHGLSETEIFDLLVSERGSAAFGAGIAAHITAQTSKQLGTAAPGPAVGVVIKHERWKYGLFNQNFLSDTFAQTELQPILSHAFNDKWSAEIGDAQYTYDWKKHHVTSIPLSGQLNRILSLESQQIQLFFRGQYNLKNESGSDKWSLVAGFTLIVNQ